MALNKKVTLSLQKQQMSMRLSILLFLMGLLSYLPLCAQPKNEIRATWLTTLGGLDFPSSKASSAAGIQRQKQELCKILDELKQAHINTVLFQTRLRGDVIYPSDIETFAESLTGHEGRNPGYDLLEFATAECHKRGMELHAWIVTIPVGNNRQVKLLGKNSVVKKYPQLCKQYKGSWYLDPGQPGTADYLARLVREIVSRYDIDGIHLDYIRYPERAQQFPDNATFRKYGKGQNLEQWRRDNITRIVRRIYTEVKTLKPWVKVSSSPVGKYADTQRYSSHGWNAYETVYQDAQAWLKEGIHDALFPMMYFPNNHFYPFALDWKENKSNRWVVPGLGIYFLHPKEKNWDAAEIIRQIHFIRKSGLDGEAYFRNRFLLENTKGILSTLKNRFYQTPSFVPPMTWADSIAPSVPDTPVLHETKEGIRLSWSPSTDNSTLPVHYRVYASNFYPVDITQAEHIVETRIDTTCYTTSSSQLYWAVTAVDRYGNESQPLYFKTISEESLPIWNHLPDLPAGGILIIYDATGTELFRTSDIHSQQIQNLAPGFYRTKILTNNGQSIATGSIVR